MAAKPMVLILSVVEILALICLVGLSMAALIAMSLLKNDFKGECPLYLTDSNYFHDVSNCNFIIAMNSVAMAIAVAVCAYRVFELLKQKTLLNKQWIPFIFITTYFLIGVLVLVSACIVTVGFNKLCKSLTEYEDNASSCRRYQESNWVIYDGSHFFDYLVAAETSNWIGFAMWMSLGGLLLFRLFCVKK